LFAACPGREHFDAEAYGEAIIRYFETAGRASLLDFLRVPNWIPRPGAILSLGAVRTMHRMVASAISARREEIARMLAGATITDEARAAAGRLLQENAAAG
jgi:hypothetical protein